MMQADTVATECQGQLRRIAASYGGNGCLYLVPDFASPLNPDVVRQAARRLPDAEPVLSCRFDIDDVAPAWRRRDALENATCFEMMVEQNETHGD